MSDEWVQLIVAHDWVDRRNGEKFVTQFVANLTVTGGGGGGGSGDSLWEQIDDEGDPSDGMIRPVESVNGVALNDMRLYYRQPGDIEHSLAWGYLDYGIDGPVSRGFGGGGGAIGENLHWMWDTDGLQAGPAGQLARVMTAAHKGVPNGIAELDGSGFVPASQLPSYVDDVLEFASVAAFPVTGESGKVYLALDQTNFTYRWSGSIYVAIGNDLALGETSSTAYRGDRGKVAFDHAGSSGNPHGTAVGDIGGLSAALDGKADVATLAEEIRDTIGATLVQGVGVVITVNDAGNTITIEATGSSDTGDHALAAKVFGG